MEPLLGAAVETVADAVVREKLVGHWNARLDDKGRIKLAAEIVSHFSTETDKRIFITTIVAEIPSIYPMRVWQQNLRILGQTSDNPEESADLEFWANSSGANSEIDQQGRLLIPAEIRTASKLDEEQLVLVPSQDRIDIYKLSQFEARRKAVAERVEEARRALQRRGLT